MKPFVFENGVALVTGAASGIGRALAEGLAARDCHLVLVDRDAVSLEKTAARARRGGVKVSTHVFDLSNYREITDLIADVTREHGRLTLLVNNAGVGLGGTFEEVTLDELEWLLDINFRAVVALTKTCLPHLLEEPGSHVVNLSSVFGLVAPPGQAAYAASKFAVRGFSEALRHELVGRVGVSVVHPGGVRTNIALSTRVAAAADRAASEQGALKFNARVLTSPDAAAATILRATARRQSRVLVGADAHFIDWVQRFLPTAYWRVLRPALEPVIGGARKRR